jgi:hypothetical protein
MEQAYMAASTNGKYPVGARQIMYQARPFIQDKTGKKLDDDYFTQGLLPDYMIEYGVSWDVTFDDRGHFSEPHTGRTFGLGTISVRNYLSSIGEPKWIEPSVTTGGIITCGPSGRYGAVLFCEKEGFLPLFEAAQFARRYDIAGMSTKGMSVTAARHLVDEICSKSDSRILTRSVLGLNSKRTGTIPDRS